MIIKWPIGPYYRGNRYLSGAGMVIVKIARPAISIDSRDGQVLSLKVDGQIKNLKNSGQIYGLKTQGKVKWVA